MLFRPTFFEIVGDTDLKLLTNVSINPKNVSLSSVLLRRFWNKTTAVFLLKINIMQRNPSIVILSHLVAKVTNLVTKGITSCYY